MQSNYVKSPLNYIGNKYRIIDQIHQYFPKDINTMVDLFCGGCDVTINTAAQKHYANDINVQVVDIFRECQKYSIDELLAYIDGTISKWGLTDTNAEAFNAFRDYYNQTRKPLDLFVLICYSFNYQIRFNSKGEFNMPFGKERSSFNNDMRLNFVKTVGRLKEVEFSTKSFQDFDFNVLSSGDFLYADPPYLISCATYNTGWGESDEHTLYGILTDLDKKGIKFALSNVSEHKGQINDILLKWVADNGYHLYDIDFNYDNCNYHGQNTDKPTREIIVTNYSVATPSTFKLF
jgi:DNA adenine methylase Dam